jgi:ureidoglycolate lyase
VGKAKNEIAWRKLSPEAFAAYGTFAAMTAPAGPRMGEPPVEFFRDMVQCHFGTTQVASFSVCRVARRPYVIDVSEYHDSCGEIVLPLDGDVLLHVAPAGPQKEFPAAAAEVFLVPRGTLCSLRPGVWHHAPFAFGCEAVNCLVVLPERTYANDCKVFALPKKEHLRIVGDGIR